ncbi:hypothetical protein Droror1_Dr00012753 [Drosera rotundifolia]
MLVLLIGYVLVDSSVYCMGDLLHDQGDFIFRSADDDSDPSKILENGWFFNYRSSVLCEWEPHFALDQKVLERILVLELLQGSDLEFNEQSAIYKSAGKETRRCVPVNPSL